MINKFITKSDDKDLVELGQFIRDTRPFRVEREWHIIFEKKSGKYLGKTKNTQKNLLQISRNPDLILIDKKTDKLLLIIELDGIIHKIKETDTKVRNEQYKKAKLPMLIITKWELDETSIFDYVNKKLDEYMTGTEYKAKMDNIKK